MRVERSRIFRPAVSALAFGLLLVACGQRAQPTSGPTGTDYFPMVPGARWLYSLRSSLGEFEVEVTARGEMPLPKGRGDVFVMEEKNLGPDLGFVEVAPVAYVVARNYVGRISGVDYAPSGGLRLLGQDQPTWILPLDPEPGHSWDQQTAIFQTPEGGGGQLGWSGEVKQRTVVSVPAGRFEDVVEVETHYRDPSEAEGKTKVIYHDYYARGVGLVRSVTEDPSGDASHRVEQVLLEYHVPR